MLLLLICVHNVGKQCWSYNRNLLGLGIEPEDEIFLAVACKIVIIVTLELLFELFLSLVEKFQIFVSRAPVQMVGRASPASHLLFVFVHRGSLDSCVRLWVSFHNTLVKISKYISPLLLRLW